MTAGFERHEQRAATGVRTRRFERQNFRVGKTGPEMISLADDPSMVDDHGSDHRIGARRASAIGRQGERESHIMKILCVASPHDPRGLVTVREIGKATARS